MIRTALATAFLLVAWPGWSQVAQLDPAAPELYFASVGAGGIKGNYYLSARGICEGVNRDHAGELRCSPEATQGSLYNLAALRRGELEFALVQSDWLHHAYHGTAIFAGDGPMEDPRSVSALYVETITILARRDIGARRFADLAGRRLDVGHPSSGRRATVGVVMQAAGLEPSEFARLYELRGEAIVPALCGGEIDATVLVVGHPSSTVARALAECDVEIVPMEGPKVDRYVEDAPYYIHADIPARMYEELDRTIPTVGIVASLVTRADVPDAAVSALAEQLLKPRSASGGGALWEGRSTSWLANAGRSAPPHPAVDAVLSASGD